MAGRAAGGRKSGWRASKRGHGAATRKRSRVSVAGRDAVKSRRTSGHPKAKAWAGSSLHALATPTGCGGLLDERAARFQAMGSWFQAEAYSPARLGLRVSEAPSGGVAEQSRTDTGSCVEPRRQTRLARLPGDCAISERAEVAVCDILFFEASSRVGSPDGRGLPTCDIADSPRQAPVRPVWIRHSEGWFGAVRVPCRSTTEHDAIRRCSNSAPRNLLSWSLSLPWTGLGKVAWSVKYGNCWQRDRKELPPLNPSIGESPSSISVVAVGPREMCTAHRQIELRSAAEWRSVQRRQPTIGRTPEWPRRSEQQNPHPVGKVSSGPRSWT